MKKPRQAISGKKRRFYEMPGCAIILSLKDSVSYADFSSKTASRRITSVRI
jgi:hypothetical protein